MVANDLERLAPLLATYLVHSTLWLAGCCVLLWLTRMRRPAIRHAAWKWSVVAGFVTALAQFTLPLSPPSMHLTFVAESARIRQLSEPISAAAPLLPAQSISIDESDNRQAMATNAAIADASSDSSVSEPVPATRPPAEESPLDRASRSTNGGSKVADWLRAAMMVWALAVAMLLIRTCVAWQRLSRLGDLKELSVGKERELLDRLLAATNIRRPVRLFRSRSGANPMAWGFRHWRIAVPGLLLDRLDRRELRALLAHELAHLARGDTRWLCAWSLLEAIGFVQPLNQIAQRQIRRTAELLSDSWAVAATGDRLSLAQALMKAAELRAGRAAPLASLAVASRSALSERIDRLMGPNDSCVDSRRKRWFTALVGLIATTAAVVWLPGVKLMAAGEFAAGDFLRSGGAAPVSTFADDPMRALDHELDSLDRELDELRPFVPNANESNPGNIGTVEAWRAIDWRRDRVREGHSRVRQMLQQVTAARRSAADHP